MASMDDEYELLRDAAALMDEFGAFGLDFHDAQGGPSHPHVPALSVTSPTDTGFIRASTAPLPVPPGALPRRVRSPSSGHENNASESDDGSYRSDGSSDHLTKTTTTSDRHVKARRSAKHTSPGGATSEQLQQQQQPSTGKNPSRERLKAELAFLRGKVGELEQELSDLRFSHEQVATAHAKTTAIAPVWRRIAERQQQRRSASEAENERLKHMLDAQIRVAKSLEHMLRKRSSAAMMDLYEGARANRKRSRLGENFESLYVHFMGDIEAAYRSVDQVFTANGLGETFDETVRGYTVKTRTWGGVEQVFIELMDVKIVPFAFARAADAVWRMTQKEFMATRRTIETLEGANDRFAVRYQTQSRSHDYVGLLDVTMVMRQFLERDRMVLVWRATNSPAEETTHEQWQNVYTEETGWIVVKCVPDDHTGLGANTAVMQSCVHLIPRWYGSESPTSVPTKINTGDFAKLVMNMYEDDVIAITEAVENMLLDEVVAVRSDAIVR